jgi:hypothetical protein
MCVTSRYAVTDSVVVIDEILRGKGFYPDADEPHLYQPATVVKEPPIDLVPPVMIPLERVSRIEPARRTTAPQGGGGGAFAGGAIVGIAATLVLLVAFASGGWGI